VKLYFAFGVTPIITEQISIVREIFFYVRIIKNMAKVKKKKIRRHTKKIVSGISVNRNR